VKARSQPRVLVRGPWGPYQVDVVWQATPYRPAPGQTQLADAAVDRLRKRGSPAHDGMAARLAALQADGDRLRVELQAARWSLRLLEDAADSLVAICVVRSEDGRWLAGRRAHWVSTWPGSWTLGAAGAVEVGESPVTALSRELHEEWRLEPAALSVEALVRVPSELVMLVGLATVAGSCEPAPDAEHDDWAWWPSDPSSWPDCASEPVRAMGLLLA
jgi:8-oxo-dGTP diphosphatase